MFYQILETLTEAAQEDCLSGKTLFAAVLTPAEWKESITRFDMGIDLEMELEHPHCTKAEVNYDSLTGSFSVPDRANVAGKNCEFAFALDERGVVFIDQTGTALDYMEAIQKTKKWRKPSLERFLYDFLEQMIADDLPMMEKYENTLNALEDKILNAKEQGVVSKLNRLRGDFLTLRSHYEQLIDLGQELEENENNFFKADQLRYFRMFTVRVERLQDIVTSLRDYSLQVRDLYQSQLDLRQNRTMTVLTVVTTIFLPLTLIVGWYGMNFVYMPELKSPYAYPIVCIVCVLIVVGCLVYFKKKKML